MKIDAIQVAEWITSPTLGSREAPTKVNALDEDDLRFWITLSSDSVQYMRGGARLKQPMTPAVQSCTFFPEVNSRKSCLPSCFGRSSVFHGEREQINLFSETPQRLLVSS